MPNVKNAWSVPNIDMDVILIAIRIATYGEKLITPITVGETEMEYTVDLRSVLDSLNSQITWVSHIPVNDDLTVFVRPINYKQVTEMANQSFETQKIMQIANDDKMPEEEKIAIFKVIKSNSWVNCCQYLQNRLKQRFYRKSSIY